MERAAVVPVAVVKIIAEMANMEATIVPEIASNGGKLRSTKTRVGKLSQNVVYTSHETAD